MQRLHPSSAFLAIAALAFGFTGCTPSDQPAKPAMRPAQVTTTQLKRGEIARTITLPALRILALQQATLYAKVAGYLKTIAVDKGDKVSDGQILAEIEAPELMADLAQFEAEANVSGVNYQRLADARQKAPDLVVPQTVDDLRGQWEIAQAKAQRARTLLGYCKIAAPFNGVITARFVDPGAFIPAATTGSTPERAALLTVMDFSRVRIQVFVPESEVRFVTNGPPVKIAPEGLPGRTFPGTVTRIAQAMDETTKSMLAEIELPNPAGEIRPGGYASVQLEVERKHDVLLAPAQAVLFEKAGPSVFTIADGKAKKTPVQTGFNDGVNVEIVSGVNPGQTLIQVGKQTLNDGQPVTVSEAK
jgi:RND family efflux transporter MFP subunit